MTERGRPPQAREILVDTIPVHDVSFAETVKLIVGWAREGSGGYVTTPNVDHIVRARREAGFRELVMGARLRVPDGMGIIYGSRLAGTPFRGAVTGRLLPEAIVKATTPDTPPIALVGGRRDAPVKAAKRLREAGASVVEWVSPQMGFAVDGAEDQEAVHRLQRISPRIVFVGLGSPKQEAWMARHQADLPQAVMVGVGQAIDVLGGVVPPAPAWMTRVGLEWAFRLVRDPRRIGRRVFVDDPPFFWWMLRSRFRTVSRPS